MFKDVSWVDYLVDSGTYPEKVRPSFLSGAYLLWDDSSSFEKAPTAAPLLRLATPSRTVKRVLEEALA